MSEDQAATPDPTPPPRELRIKHLQFTVHNPPANASSENGPIDVRDHFRAAYPSLLPGTNAAANRENEIHGILRANLKRDIAAGRFDLGVLDDSKRRRRIRHYWIALVVVNGLLGAFAFWVGHTTPVLFVFAIAGMAMFSATLTWKTFFLRTNY